MKKLTRLISLLLCMALLLPSVLTPATAGSNTASVTATQSTISVGECITLGRYEGKPIVWRCVLIDENGPLMLSENILCNKAYDAAGESAEYHTDGWGYIRKNRGSNCWSDSSIRQWLNSSGNVEYTHCPPEYQDELGFLSNFSASELALVKTVTQKSYLNEWETHRTGYVDGGIREPSHIVDIAKLNDDTSSYWYQNVTDMFFLLERNQLYNIYKNNPAYLYAEETYYTRYVANEGASYENIFGIGATSNFTYCAAPCSALGIRPAFYLNLDSAVEVGKDNTPFDLTVDGYSFANSMPAFEYNIFSKIPLEAYTAVYGSKGKQLRKSDSTWNGSCFGMAATAALFNDGILDINDYVRNPINLNTSVYSGLKKDLLSGEHFNYIDKNQEAKKLIDKYQIWQSSIQGKEWSNQIAWQVADAEANQVDGNLSNVLKHFDNYIVCFWWSDGGHAVVIDSNRPPINLGGGWYRIYIYDPNNPYFGYFNGKNAESCYDYAQLRHIEVNIITNHWRVDIGVNSDSSPIRIGYDYDDNYIPGCQLHVLNPSTLPTSFDGTAEWYYSKNSANTANLCCTNAVIYDTTGNIVCQISDNKLVYVDGSITVATKTGLLSDNITTPYIIELPFDEFTIEFQSEGTAQVFNGEYAYGLVSDAAGSATVTTADGITVNGDENSVVDVVIENVNDNDSFTSVNVIVENDGQNPAHISLNKSNTLNIDSVNDCFDATIYWDGQENEYLIENVTASEMAETDITEYALASGEILPNDLGDADVTYQNVLVHDGTIKTISPVVKYQGKTLELGVDYIIEGNTSETTPGTYSVTVIGQNKYCGTLVLEYEVIPKITLEDASLSTQHDNAVDYMVDKNLIEDVGYADPYVVFEQDGVTTTVSNYTVSGDCYVFTLSDIVPGAMNDIIHATLYATYNGVTYEGETTTFTVTTTPDGANLYVGVVPQIATVNLRPSAAGLYFSGNFTVDDSITVIRRGIAVSLENSLPVADGSDATSMWTTNTNSVLISNILNVEKANEDNAQNATKTIYARAYVFLDDGTYIYSNTASVTLRQMVQAIDSQWDRLSDAQKGAISAMYTEFADTMCRWHIPHLKGHLAA